MQDAQRLAHRDQHVERLGQRERRLLTALGEVRRECHAGQQLHHQEVHAAVAPDAVHRHQPRMAEGRQRPRLAQQRLAPDVGPARLEGHLAPELAVARLEDLAHAARADDAHDLVGIGDHFADGKEVGAGHPDGSGLDPERGAGARSPPIVVRRRYSPVGDGVGRRHQVAQRDHRPWCVGATSVTSPPTAFSTDSAPDRGGIIPRRGRNATPPAVSRRNMRVLGDAQPSAAAQAGQRPPPDQRAGQHPAIAVTGR